MFNIPIRKERDLQVEDFVVPVHSKTFEERPIGNKNFVANDEDKKPQMMWVISNDTMRNGEYFSAIRVIEGKDPSSNYNMIDSWKNEHVRIYKRSDWKIERNPVEYYYYSIDDDDRSSYYNSLPTMAQNINWYYRKKVLPQYGLELNLKDLRSKWRNVKQEERNE